MIQPLPSIPLHHYNSIISLSVTTTLLSPPCHCNLISSLCYCNLISSGLMPLQTIYLSLCATTTLLSPLTIQILSPLLYILLVYSQFSDRVGLPLHKTTFPGVLMNSIPLSYHPGNFSHEVSILCAIICIIPSIFSAVSCIYEKI